MDSAESFTHIFMFCEVGRGGTVRCLPALWHGLTVIQQHRPLRPDRWLLHESLLRQAGVKWGTLIQVMEEKRYGGHTGVFGGLV